MKEKSDWELLMDDWRYCIDELRSNRVLRKLVAKLQGRKAKKQRKITEWWKSVYENIGQGKNKEDFDGFKKNEC